MGLFDRFKKGGAGSPDALTREGVARVRAVPGVQGVEVLDADTLSVSWDGVAEPARLSLAGIREAWSSTQGFERIEVMDDFIASVGPPTDTGGNGPSITDPSITDRATDPATDDPAPTETAAPDAAAPPSDTDWEAARPRLRPVVARPGPSDADTVRWSVGGVLETTVVLDDPVGLPIGRAELAEWGVDEATVRAAAEANQAAVDPALDPIGPDEPAWVPTRPSGHLAGWLCAPERLLAAAGLTEAVVLVPLPTELVLVDPAAVDLVESILASTRTIVEQESRTLWPAPFLVRPDQVEPWDPPADHPCAALVAQMRQLSG